MNNKNSEYREKLNEVIIEKRQELKHRRNRLNNNIFAGICHKSILAQRKTIFYLELQINSLEYKLQHNCGKLGHIARDCKLPKSPKKKQISEIIIDDEKYTQIEYVDYELESNDSIYELSENEIENSSVIESDNEYDIND